MTQRKLLIAALSALFLASPLAFAQDAGQEVPATAASQDATPPAGQAAEGAADAQAGDEAPAADAAATEGTEADAKEPEEEDGKAEDPANAGGATL